MTQFPKPQSPFGPFWGWNWVGLGWDWVLGDWGLRGLGLGLDNLTRVKNSREVSGQTDTFLMDPGGERLAAG